MNIYCTREVPAQELGEWLRYLGPRDPVFFASALQTKVLQTGARANPLRRLAKPRKLGHGRNAPTHQPGALPPPEPVLTAIQSGVFRPGEGGGLRLVLGKANSC